MSVLPGLNRIDADGDGSVEQWQQADEEVRKNLPPGVKLVRTLRGHTDWIGRIAWSPDGQDAGVAIS